MRYLDASITEFWLEPDLNSVGHTVEFFQQVFPHMYHLRHLHLNAALSTVAERMNLQSVFLQELTLHGPYIAQVAIHLTFHFRQRKPSIMLHYPDLETLPCPDHPDGWAAHLAATAPPHVLASLDAALQHRIRTYQKQQVDAIAQVLPVVGVPELVAALAFKFRAPGDWAELKQQTE
jgi:hypothetical protein